MYTVKSDKSITSIHPGTKFRLYRRSKSNEPHIGYVHHGMSYALIPLKYKS